MKTTSESMEIKRLNRIRTMQYILNAKTTSRQEIASALGFNDYFYFLKTFKRVTGLTPKQYKHGYTAPDTPPGGAGPQE